MKKIKSTLVMTLMLTSLLLSAQPNQEGKNRSEKIESMRIAFITENLNFNALPLIMAIDTFTENT